MPDPCAHVGFAFAAARILAWAVPGNICVPPTPRAALALDVLLLVMSNAPDLLDKPLFLFRVFRGTRSIGHTLIFLVLATLAAAGLVARFPEALGVLLFGGQTPACIARITATAIASHLAADLCFGHVPLFWPLQSFREISMVYTPHTKRWKTALDLAAIAYVSFCTELPARLGGARTYAAVLVGFLTESIR